MRSRLGSAFILTFAAQLITNLQGLVVLPIVICWAGPGTYGAYILVNISVAEIYALVTSGITYRYSRNLVSASSASERRELFEPQFSFQMFALLIFSAAVLLAGGQIEKLFGAADLHIEPWLLIALVTSNVIQAQVIRYYRCTLRFVPVNAVNAGTALVFMAALQAFAVLHGGLTLDSLLVVQVSCVILVSVPFAALMLQEIGLPRLNLPLGAFARDMRAGLSLTLDMIVDFILGSGDRYLITLYLSVTDVGRYQPAYQLASVVLFLPRLVVAVLSPIVSRMIDAGNRADAEKIIETSLSLFLMMGVPFVVGTLMVGPSLVLVLTNADVAEASRWVSPLVAAGSIFLGILWILDTIVTGLNRLKLIFIADLKGAVVNFGMNVALLPLFKSITVPAVATLIGYAVSATALSLALRPLWRLHIEWVAILRFCVAAAVIGIVLWLLGFRPGEVRPVGIVYLMASIAACAVIYFAALSALGGFGRREWAEIKTLLHSQAPATGGLPQIEPSAGS